MKILYTVKDGDGTVLRSALTKKEAKAYTRTRPGLVLAICTCGWKSHPTPVWAALNDETRHHRLSHTRALTP